MSKGKIADMIGAGLIAAGIFAIRCRGYERGMNRIFEDIKANNYRVVDEAGDVVEYVIKKKTLFGEKIVGEL